ncbi:MAG: NAD-dependent deacylase [Rubrimonas sp.]
MSPRIVILTGAGISAESGLGTFRGAGGLWENVRLEEIATPEAFAADPARVRAFYDARRAACAAARPNAAHHALARLQRERPGETLIVTQNVDDLHERAGATDLIHMHGELMSALCAACGAQAAWTGPMTAEDACPACGRTGRLRPDVVWFGETPYRMDEIGRAIDGCALFVSIGTSGQVWPAAGFVMDARMAGARTLELNLEPSDGSDLFDERRSGPATRMVPAWVAEILGA